MLDFDAVEQQLKILVDQIEVAERAIKALPVLVNPMWHRSNHTYYRKTWFRDEPLGYITSYVEGKAYDVILVPSDDLPVILAEGVSLEEGAKLLNAALKSRGCIFSDRDKEVP